MFEGKIKFNDEQEDSMRPDPSIVCKVKFHFIGSLILDLYMCLGEIKFWASKDSSLFQEIFYHSTTNRWIKLNYGNLAYYTVESIDGEPIFIEKRA